MLSAPLRAARRGPPYWPTWLDRPWRCAVPGVRASCVPSLSTRACLSLRVSTRANADVVDRRPCVTLARLACSVAQVRRFTLRTRSRMARNMRSFVWVRVRERYGKSLTLKNAGHRTVALSGRRCRTGDKLAVIASVRAGGFMPRSVAVHRRTHRGALCRRLSLVGSAGGRAGGTCAHQAGRSSVQGKDGHGPVPRPLLDRLVHSGVR